MNTLARPQPLMDYVAPNDLLVGRKILITGASRGIGRALSVSAAACGAELILLARDVKALESLADEIGQQGGVAPSLIPANLEGASVDNYAEFARLIDERYGCLDGLVLNAGVLGEMTNIENYDALTWARVFQVNVHSQFLQVQSLLPLLRKSTNGSIVFTSSSVGRRGRAYWGAYSASKFAIEGMMQTLADELQDSSSIRVNSLNPGRVRTAMRAAAYPAEDPTTLLEPTSVCPAFLYLLGPDSVGTHGQTLDAQAS